MKPLYIILFAFVKNNDSYVAGLGRKLNRKITDTYTFLQTDTYLSV